MEIVVYPFVILLVLMLAAFSGEMTLSVCASKGEVGLLERYP